MCANKKAACKLSTGYLTVKCDLLCLFVYVLFMYDV